MEIDKSSNNEDIGVFAISNLHVVRRFSDIAMLHVRVQRILRVHTLGAEHVVFDLSNVSI